jgi:predicted permease
MGTEFRLALRMLARRPILSAAIITTIGLSIAATTLAFAVVNGVLLAPLPYAEPDRLVSVWEWHRDSDNRHNSVSPANFYAWKEQLRSFDKLANLIETGVALTGDGEPEQVGAISISPAYFEMVGATALVGRLYGNDEDRENGPRVAVLSEGFWRRRFGADPKVVGRTIEVNGRATEVLGVLPARYDFVPRYRFGSTGTRDVWLPPQFGASALTWGGRFLQVLGRLAPGATIESAQAEAAIVGKRLEAEFPERNTRWGINVIPLHDELVGDVRTTVLTVFGAVLFVLLIACSNVANLLLTRATERQQEMAVRAALGAARTRIFRQLLAESLVLSTIGGAVGLGLAAIGIKSLVRSAPDLPRLEMITVDSRVIGFTLLAVVATAVLFGLVPALQLTGRELGVWLTQRSGSGRRQAQRLRSAFVGAQVALSFVLLVGAGLLIRSLINRLTTGIGFSLDNLVTAEISISGPRRGQQIDRFDRIVEHVATVPGIKAVSAASVIPMGGEAQSTGFMVVGRPIPPRGQETVADGRVVHHYYCRTM